MISSIQPVYALDASALLALLLEEPGHEEVRAILDRAFIHSVNVAEVAGKLIRKGVPGPRAARMIEVLGLDIDDDFGFQQAALCGELIANTRQQGLSLGDCVCLTVATSVGGTAVTADRRWQELNGQRIGKNEIRVQVIR